MNQTLIFTISNSPWKSSWSAKQKNLKIYINWPKIKSFTKVKNITLTHFSWYNMNLRPSLRWDQTRSISLIKSMYSWDKNLCSRLRSLSFNLHVELSIKLILILASNLKDRLWVKLNLPKNKLSLKMKFKVIHHKLFWIMYCYQKRAKTIILYAKKTHKWRE